MGMLYGKGKGNMHQLEIHPDDALIICHFSGHITIDEIEEATDELTALPDYSAELDGVSDFRHAQVTFTREELARFIRSSVENPVTRSSWCILADSPMETAMALIFASEMKKIHPVDVFSTVEGASDFLKKDLSDRLSENYRSRRTFSAPVARFA